MAKENSSQIVLVLQKQTGNIPGKTRGQGCSSVEHMTSPREITGSIPSIAK